jgi:hypothetical protein
MAAPWHPFIIGVMVITAVTGSVPVLMAVKDGMFPVPDAASPIDGFELVQLKLTPRVSLR